MTVGAAGVAPAPTVLICCVVRAGGVNRPPGLRDYSAAPAGAHSQKFQK